MIKQLLAAAAALVLAAPVAASAQEVPSYAELQGDQQIHGRITAFDGAYNLQVRDDNGYVDNVELHDGTIINPTGLTLAPGMIVSILGDGAGAAFDANEIDTPYVFENAVPYYGGHPWNYYGPSISFGFFFGNTGWWHGSRETRVVVNDYTTNEPGRVLRAPAERPFAAVPRGAVPLERSASPHAAAPAERGSTAHDATRRQTRTTNMQRGYAGGVAPFTCFATVPTAERLVLKRYRSAEVSARAGRNRLSETISLARG